MEALHLALSRAAVDPLVVLVTVGAAGAALYAALLMAFDAPYVRGLWRLFRGDRSAAVRAELGE